MPVLPMRINPSLSHLHHPHQRLFSSPLSTFSRSHPAHATSPIRRLLHSRGLHLHRYGHCNAPSRQHPFHSSIDPLSATSTSARSMLASDAGAEPADIRYECEENDGKRRIVKLKKHLVFVFALLPFSTRPPIVVAFWHLAFIPYRSHSGIHLALLVLL
ncbi:hypothetical protein B0H13DRAFT_809644 [Mycena leptocephala]|nr:hypothetical protein B0H13DRAFT_809644 [Mycena leptocephala]